VGPVVGIEGRNVVVETSVIAAGEEAARGRVVALQIQEDFGAASTWQPSHRANEEDARDSRRLAI
jgi:hypothetical protein